MSNNITVLSLGGSIVAPPEGIDANFLKSLRELLLGLTSEGQKFVIVIGGGAPARRYMDGARGAKSDIELDDLDRIGIAATRLNAELVRVVLADLAEPAVVTDPTTVSGLERAVLVSGGWKPGRSTDAVAVELAVRLGAKTVLNLSNIAWVYDSDPRKNPEAKILPRLTWAEFLSKFGGEWSPGLSAPFDPVAAKVSADANLRVIVADGRNLENLGKLLQGQDADGTIIE